MSHLWKELHERALNFEGKSDYTYLINFGKKIPRYTKGCKCKEFWDNWMKQNPPTFNKYFEWTVKAHNRVNLKLGKPQFTVKQARNFYQK